jgi:hypothetical protein
MRHAVARAVVAAAVVAACIAAGSRRASATAPSVVGVRQLDIGYRLGEGGLKIRATLVTGEALEYSTSDAREVQAILEVAQACGSGASGMSAVVEASALRAVQCSLRRGFGN